MYDKYKPSVSFLLGAGFSVPMGYPDKKLINGQLTSLDSLQVYFDLDGLLRVGVSPDDNKKNEHQTRFKLLKQLITVYSQNRAFDYEEFMDFLLCDKEPFTDEYKQIKEKYPKSGIESYASHLKWLPTTYSQIIEHLLRKHMNHPSSYEKYEGFISLLKAFKRQGYSIRMHSLNHDLLLEALLHNAGLDYSDGFEESHSPYYGKLKHDNHQYICRLKRFTGVYGDCDINLYKLHGSLGYAVFHEEGSSGNIVSRQELKLPHGIDATDLLCEKRNRLVYEQDLSFYAYDFLTGAHSKGKQYRKRFYRTLMKSFRENLRIADYLIIIGYGGNDRCINKYIRDNFDYRNKKKMAFVISPDESVKYLPQGINVLRPTHLVEELSPEMILGSAGTADIECTF